MRRPPGALTFTRRAPNLLPCPLLITSPQKEIDMPAFQVNVPHNLGKEQALERVKSFLEKVAERYKDQVSKMEGTWVDNVLKFAMTTYGFTISGTLTVDENVAHIDGQLPFAAMAFKGKIEKTIADELGKRLA